MRYNEGDRVALRVEYTFDDGQVVLPAGSEGTVEISGPTITGVVFDDDPGTVNYRIVKTEDLRSA